MPKGVYKRTEEQNRHNSESHKGQIPWIKGRRMSEEAKIKSSNSKKKLGLTGEKCHWWKGENAGIVSKHLWITKHRGKPNYCEICKRTDRKKYEWSNKDHKYSRKLEDYQRLCKKCHIRYDIENNNFWNRKRDNFGKFK